MYKQYVTSEAWIGIIIIYALSDNEQSIRNMKNYFKIYIVEQGIIIVFV